MSDVIRITDFHAPELDVYARPGCVRYSFSTAMNRKRGYLLRRVQE